MLHTPYSKISFKTSLQSCQTAAVLPNDCPIILMWDCLLSYLTSCQRLLIYGRCPKRDPVYLMTIAVLQQINTESYTTVSSNTLFKIKRVDTVNLTGQTKRHLQKSVRKSLLKASQSHVYFRAHSYPPFQYSFMSLPSAICCEPPYLLQLHHQSLRFSILFLFNSLPPLCITYLHPQIVFTCFPILLSSFSLYCHSFPFYHSIFSLPPFHHIRDTGCRNIC